MTTVHVTAQDIADGKANTADGCPVALAVRRAMGLSPYHEVDISNMFTIASVYGMDTPPVVQRFIKDFDAGRPVKPFSYELSYYNPQRKLPPIRTAEELSKAMREAQADGRGKGRSARSPALNALRGQLGR